MNSLFLSLSIPLRYQFLVFDSLGLSFGIDTFVPLTFIQNTVKISSLDKDDPNKIEEINLENDLEEKFKSEKNTFALSIKIGTYFSF